MAQNFLSDIKLGDNIYIRLGDATNGDLQIYHDGNNSFIKDTGTGSLIIPSSTFAVTNTADTEYMAKLVQDAQVELYYNGIKTFETASTGVVITGNADPATDSLYDLGTDTVRWANIYADTLHGDGSNITGVAADKSQAVTLTVKNTSGGSLSKGTIVHAHPSVSPPSGNVIEVIAADNDDTTKMPAIGILNETLADEAEGEAVMFGRISGISTTDDGTSTGTLFSIGDELYVSSTPGLFTNVKPTGTKLIQKIAVVIKSHATNGTIEVFGAGRTNDVPTPLYIDHANQRVGIGETSPDTIMEIVGADPILTIRDSDTAGATSNARIRFAESGAGDTLDHYWDVGLNPTVALTFSKNGTEHARFDLNGNLGIGTTSPQNILHVKTGASGASSFDSRNKIILENNGEAYFSSYVPDNSFSGIRFHDTTGLEGFIDYYHGTQGDCLVYSATNHHKFLIGSSEKVRISSDGKVFIGKTSTGLANIGVEFDPTGQLKGTAANVVVQYLNRTSSDGAILEFRKDNSAVGSIGSTTSYLNSNLGIGTTSPGAKLDIHTATNSNGLLIREDTDDSITHNFYIDSADNGLAVLYANGQSAKIQLNTAGDSYFNGGNVGIGTGSPSAKLDIEGASSLLMTRTSSGLAMYNEVDSGYSKLYLYQTGGNSKVVLNTNGDTYFNGGNVGIGTSSPSSKLNIAGLNSSTFVDLTASGAGASRAIRFIDGGTPTKYNWLVGAQYNVDDAFEITASTAVGGTTFNSPLFLVKQSGNIGIGTASPNTKLGLSDSATLTAVYQQFTNGTTGTTSSDGTIMGIDSDGDFLINNQEAKTIKLYTSDTERMRIASDGTITLNAYGAGYLKTDANGVISVDTDTIEDTLQSVTDRGASTDNAITISTSTNRTLTLDYTGGGTGSYSIMSFKQSGTEQFRLWGNYTDNYLSFYNDQASVHQLKLNSDGSTTFAGVLALPDGSVSAPSIGNTGDTNTGMYWPGDHQLGFAVNGSRKFYMSETQGYFQNLSSGISISAGGIDVTGDSTFAGNVDVNGGELKISGNFAKLFFEDTAGTDEDAYIVNNANGLFFGKTNSPSGSNDILSLDLSNKNATFAGDVTIGGDLIVSGDTVTLNTQTVEVEDNIIQLNTTQGSPDTATAATSGISIYRGDGVTQASFIFDDADDTWDLTNNLAVAGNIEATGAEFNGSVNIDDSLAVNFDYDAANVYLYVRKHQSNDGGIVLQSKTSLGATQNDWQILNEGTTGDLKFYAYGLADHALILDREDGNATFEGDVFTPGLYVNSTSAVSGTQVAIVGTGNENLQRWGSTNDGSSQASYRFRIDQNYHFIGNSGSGDKITIESSNGNITATGGTIQMSMANMSSYQLNGTYVMDSSRNLVNIGTIGSTYFSTSSNINSTGDGGVTVGGYRLGFNQSGTRSWTIKAEGGNLNVYSGDGNGGFNVAGLSNGIITDKVITGGSHLVLDTSLTSRDLLVKTGSTTHLTIDGSDSSATFAGAITTNANNTFKSAAGSGQGIELNLIGTNTSGFGSSHVVRSRIKTITDNSSNAYASKLQFYTNDESNNLDLALTLDRNQKATFAGDVQVDGNLIVTGATTSVNVEDLNVEQGEITLNYGSGDTSAAANGAGIRIQDAVNSTTDATILWDATDDEFDFSHGATFAGNVELGDSSNISMSNAAPGQLQIQGSGYTGAIALDATAMYVYHNSSLRDLVLGTNETARLTIAGSNGNATFTGSVTLDNGSPEIYFKTGATHYNWMIAAQENISAALEFTPANSVGTTGTHNAPALTLYADRSATFAGSATIETGINLESGTLIIKNATGDSSGLRIYQDSSDTARIYNYYDGPLVLGQNNAAVITIGADTNTTFAGDITAPGQYGESYSVDSTSGTVAIIDTVTLTASDHHAVYEVVAVGNPNSNGSGLYRDIIFGKIIVSHGYTNPNVLRYIHFVRESPLPRDMNTSGTSNNLTMEVVFWDGSSESETFTSNSGTPIIRVKIDGYVGTVGANTSVRLKRIM